MSVLTRSSPPRCWNGPCSSQGPASLLTLEQAPARSPPRPRPCCAGAVQRDGASRRVAARRTTPRTAAARWGRHCRRRPAPRPAAAQALLKRRGPQARWWRCCILHCAGWRAARQTPTDGAAARASTGHTWMGAARRRPAPHIAAPSLMPCRWSNARAVRLDAQAWMLLAVSFALVAVRTRDEHGARGVRRPRCQAPQPCSRQRGPADRSPAGLAARFAAQAVTALALAAYSRRCAAAYAQRREALLLLVCLPMTWRSPMRQLGKWGLRNAARARECRRAQRLTAAPSEPRRRPPQLNRPPARCSQLCA